MRKAVRFTLLLVLVSSMACNLFVDDKEGQFRGFFASIETGLSEDEVRQLFRDHFPTADSNGWPVLGVNDGGWWFTLDPRDGTFNSELIHVVFDNGVVESKRYLPD